jgi:hypothetical protein
MSKLPRPKPTVLTPGAREFPRSAPDPATSCQERTSVDRRGPRPGALRASRGHGLPRTQLRPREVGRVGSSVRPVWAGGMRRFVGRWPAAS